MQDNRVPKSMLSAEQAILQMLSEVAPLTQTVSVSLSAALDRVLAQPVVSGINVPGYDNAAMDGYALRAVEVSPNQPLTVAGVALAGHAFTDKVPAGSCVRITTGAVMPAELDTVVMQEQVELTQTDLQQQIVCQLVPSPGEHVRRGGEDIAKGAEVFAAGHKLRPADIGLLASLGIAQLPHLYSSSRINEYSSTFSSASSCFSNSNSSRYRRKSIHDV